MTTRFLRSTLAAAFVALGFASAAEATPYGIRVAAGGVGIDNIFAADGLWDTVDVTVNGTSYLGLGAGVFKLEITTDDPNSPTAVWQSLRSFCAEVDQFINLPNSYVDGAIEASMGTTAQRDAVQRLWQERFVDAITTGSTEFDGTGATSKQRAAAFQVALWEIELDNGNIDLDTGDFVLGTTGALRDLANIYLGIAYDPLIARDVSVMALISAASQDLLMTPEGPGGPGGGLDPVPAPASLVLLGAALAGLATLRRRNQA